MNENKNNDFSTVITVYEMCEFKTRFILCV